MWSSDNILGPLMGKTDGTGAWYFDESESLVKHVSQIVSCTVENLSTSLRYKRQFLEAEEKIAGIHHQFLYKIYNN